MRPDLLWVMTDQQRADQVGWLDPTFETPTLDALAQRGVAFDAATSASTVCVPARNALLTGLQAHRTPAQDNGIALAEGHWTIARALRDAGYQTALIGKMHQSPVHADHGFDLMRMCEHPSALSFGPIAEARGDTTDDYHHWLLEQDQPDWRLGESEQRRRWTLPLELHPTEWVEREATKVLEQRDPNRPLLLVVSYPHPHAPYNPPEPYASQYAPATSVLPEEGYEVNLGLPLEFQVATEAGQRATGEVRPAGLAAFLATVRGLVRHIDDSIGRLLEHVDLDRTTLAFTSDHGDYAGHRGLQRKAPWIPFEDLSRVPFVWAGHGVEAVGRVAAPVQSCDLAQTFLELAEVPAPDLPFAGRSLVPHLAGRPSAAELDRAVFSGTSLGWPSVRAGRHKLIRHTSGAEVLFDLEADPGERTDLAAHPDPDRDLVAVRDELRARLLAELG